MPHAVLVHDNFVGPTGMGRVTQRHATWLLDAGWHVTLVGENVASELEDQCRVIRVPAQRRLPSSLQQLGWWAPAPRAPPRVRGDVVHVHSPHLASSGNLLTSHFIAAP